MTFFSELCGVKVVIREPRFRNELQTVRYDVHPIIRWLASFLPIDPFIECEKYLPVEYDRGLIERFGNTLIMTEYTLDQIKKEREIKNV